MCFEIGLWQPLPVSLVNRLTREQDVTTQTIILRDQPSFWGDFNGTTLIFSVCQFKAVLLGLFPAKFFCATLTVLPLNGWELVICFYLEQLSPVHKAARLLWNVPRVHFPVMLRVKTDTFPKGSKCFQRQMSGFNCKNKYPA